MSDPDAAMQAIKEAGEVLADFASGGGYLPQDVDEQRAAIISAAEGLVAEIERLREALERIANLRSVTRYASIWNFDRRVRAIARAALGEQ